MGSGLRGLGGGMESIVRHWETIAAYVGVVVPWIVETKLRFLGLLLSWPAVALYLGTAFMIMYRVQFGRLIDRIRGGKFGAFEVHAEGYDQVVNAPAPKLPEVKQPPVTQALEVNATALELCKKAVDEYKTAFHMLSDWIGFERALNLIFGSQLEFLRELRAHPGIGPVMTYYYFGKHQASAPPGIPQIAPWIGWLEFNNKFVQATANAGYQLTPRGLAFLKYIDDNYVPGTPFRHL